MIRCKMYVYFAFLWLNISIIHSLHSQTQPANKNTALPAGQRVADLLKQMTLEEKAAMLSGAGWMDTATIPRLSIPAIKMADGPMGVRSWMGSSALTSSVTNPVKIESTAFPSGIAMASTWDAALVEHEGKAIAQEVRALGRNMILGPTVNINRVPLWGRNFEGYGEDPYLAGQLAVAYVHGVQSERVIPSVKHFAANNQEFERHRIDERIDERALHEIYLPAFKAAVQQGNAWSVMSCYNLVNGHHCAESDYLLTDILKKELDFKGFVVSDWASTYSTAATVNAGMDLEMPGGPAAKAMLARPQAQEQGSSGTWLTPDKVLAAVQTGQISEATIDDHVGRILRVIIESGLMDHPQEQRGEVDTSEQRAVACQGETEGIVLLKNEGSLLPLNPAKIHSIAVIGPDAVVARTGGGGSSRVQPKFAVSPLEGIQKRAGSRIQVTSAMGVGMEGEDVGWDLAATRKGLLETAVDVAAKADVAIVVVGRYWKNESEGFDVKSMDLPAGQDELVAAVEKANPHTVVVLNTGDPVTMTKWIDSTPALLDMWYGGEEGGNALAAILFGDANPSGKLTITMPKRLEDSPAMKTYPGQNLHTDYAEGIYIGYRYYDTKNVDPQFPFGFGLSYTKFEYRDPKVVPFTTFSGSVQQKGVIVRATIKNTGNRAGAEIAELYIHDGHSKIDRPAHELKGFQRVELNPGESKTVNFKLDQSAFEYWSPESKQWTLDPGTFEIQVGASSRDIRLKTPVEVSR